MKPTNVEIEAKLIARDAAALRRLPAALRRLCVSVIPLGSRLIRDCYLDTPGWRLRRAGYACRIRRVRGTATLALKSLRRPKGGVSVREEFEETLKGRRVGPLYGDERRVTAQSDRGKERMTRCHPEHIRFAQCKLREGAAWDMTPNRGQILRFAQNDKSQTGPLSAMLRKIIGRELLRPIFQIRNRRRMFEVICADGLKAEVCADDFTVSAGKNARRLAEVELEVIRGDRTQLRRLARALMKEMGLAAGTRAKYQQGLMLGHGRRNGLIATEE